MCVPPVAPRIVVARLEHRVRRADAQRRRTGDALRLVSPARDRDRGSSASSRAAAVILSLPIASRAWIVNVCVTPATTPASAAPLASKRVVRRPGSTSTSHGEPAIGTREERRRGHDLPARREARVLEEDRRAARLLLPLEHDVVERAGDERDVRALLGDGRVPRVDDELVVDVQARAVVGEHVQRVRLARARAQLARPARRDVVARERRDGADAPVERDGRVDALDRRRAEHPLVVPVLRAEPPCTSCVGPRTRRRSRHYGRVRRQAATFSSAHPPSRP